MYSVLALGIGSLGAAVKWMVFCVYAVELARWVWQWWVGVFCMSVKTMKGQHFIRELTVFHYSRWWTVSVALSVTERSRGINSYCACACMRVCVLKTESKGKHTVGQTVLSTLGRISLNIFNQVGSRSGPPQHPLLAGATSALERFLLTESQIQPWLPWRRVSLREKEERGETHLPQWKPGMVFTGVRCCLWCFLCFRYKSTFLNCWICSTLPSFTHPVYSHLFFHTCMKMLW